MVNTGKPSGACATCKRRKIKCDETRPKCIRCQVFGRPCPGFEPKEVVRFQDETAKYSTNGENKSKGISRSKPAVCFPDLPYESLGLQINSVSPEDAAVAFFFDHYVPSWPRYYASRGLQFNYLREIYENTFSDSGLHQATTAVALAVISRFSDKSHLRGLALDKYGQALRMLAFALGDKDAAKTDATLMSAMLLIFYETLVGEQTPTTRKKHFEGLAFMSKNRGDVQFRTRISLGLFRATRKQIVMRSLHVSEPMDEFWTRDDSPEVNNQREFLGAPALRMSVQLTVLRKRAKDLLAAGQDISAYAKASDLLAEAYSLDGKMISKWSEQRTQVFGPAQLGYQVKFSDHPNSSRCWNDTEHIYQDVMHAIYMNAFRINRIYLQAVVITCLRCMLGTEEQLVQDPRYAAACNITQEMIDDICACIPGYICDDLPSGTQDGVIDDATRATIAEKSLAAYNTIWPLFVASTVEIIPEAQRLWIKGRLYAMADRYGFGLASSIAQTETCVIYKPEGTPTGPGKLENNVLGRPVHELVH